jgi:predicted HicB family RNase H-like nuclease
MEPKKEKSPLKRMITEIPHEIHHEIKLHALLKNMTIRQYVMQAVIEKIRKDREYNE